MNNTPHLKFFFLNVFLFLIPVFLSAQNSFKVIPLGVKGGADESNLSSYMLAPYNSNDYVCLDAGTLYAGIRKARENGLFRKNIDRVLRENIKGYLISHAHLDHIAGMILNSPDDTSKNIYALPSVIDVLKSHYFTWKSWANFTDEGDPPTLKKYHYVNLAPSIEIDVQHTDMKVTAFSLSHGNPYESTAFLIRSNDNYLLYLGDTGPDEIEKSDKLDNLWKAIAPLIQSKKLKALFIEVSFSNKQPDKALFGHLTPKWLMSEMDSLGVLTGINEMKNFPVVITHIKPLPGNEKLIKKELLNLNQLQLKIIYPRQGKMLKF
ncbi:MAG: 3',5'-cyclic-nucleotide phosphodiesterase [Ginsengibacter sp.]